MIFLMRFKVEGRSMEPTFPPGTTLLASSIPYIFIQPKITDVVVINDPRTGRLLLKRITKKGKNQFFVAGDNPGSSTDSRTFGPISKEMIVGKVIFKIS